MKKFFPLLLFSILIPACLFSEMNQDIQVELKFFNQTYRLNEPIEVEINIVNNSLSSVSFAVSPLIYETIFFVLRTPKNEVLPPMNQFQVEMQDNSSSSGDFRNITLLPQESFSRVIDITRWFDIRESGYYYIKGLFYPNPDEKNKKAESINYKILIKPPLTVESKLTEEQQKRADEMEKSMLFPPYDVVSDLLDAKMTKDWERFLSHIDAEKLINSFEDYKNAYNNARAGRYRLEVLDNFKSYLTVHWQDRIMGYKIIKSTIEENRAVVIAEVDYRINLLNYGLQYTFYLYKNHQNQWMIYDYTAVKIR